MRDKRVNRGRANRGPQAAGQPPDEDTAAIYALMNEAEALYKAGFYRRAIKVCRKLAELDPTNAMPEEMIAGCKREIRKRRAVALVILTAVVVGILTFGAVYSYATRIQVRPEPGLLRLRERQAQAFALKAPMGYHTSLEYEWRLLDAQGRAVPGTERGTLSQHETTPWQCVYRPPHNLVRGADGCRPVIRRLVVTGSNAARRKVVQAGWTIEVSDVPLPPRIISVTPPTEDTLSIVAGDGSATFKVSAADGDGGSDLTYEWLLGAQLAHKGTEPSWTYRPPADAVPPGKTGREPSYDPPPTLTCRISNRFGEPLPVEATWKLRIVRSNAAPQLIALEPEIPSVLRIKEGQALKVTVKAYDPDENETLRYLWELDGAVLSRRAWCKLEFPHSTTEKGKDKELTLRLTVTDSCGAAIERSWTLLVLDAPAPLVPGD